MLSVSGFFITFASVSGKVPITAKLLNYQIIYG